MPRIVLFYLQLACSESSRLYLDLTGRAHDTFRWEVQTESECASQHNAAAGCNSGYRDLFRRRIIFLMWYPENEGMMVPCQISIPVAQVC